TRWPRDWSSDVCSSDLKRLVAEAVPVGQTQVQRRRQRERGKREQTDDLRPDKHERPEVVGGGPVPLPPGTRSSRPVDGRSYHVRSEERRVGKVLRCWEW